jgi:hypothetical protein
MEQLKEGIWQRILSFVKCISFNHPSNLIKKASRIKISSFYLSLIIKNVLLTIHCVKKILLNQNHASMKKLHPLSEKSPSLKSNVNYGIRLLILLIIGITFVQCGGPNVAEFVENPFPGERGDQLDMYARYDIWDHTDEGFLAEFPKVARNEVVAFALYTHDNGRLKITAQMYPLKPTEEQEVILEFQKDGSWEEEATAQVIYPGWSAHFSIENWDNTKDVPYRIRHAEEAFFEGLIRKDPINKEEIVVASLSCNSNHDRGDREAIVEKLKAQDPDLLFFAGDQSYDHTEHTVAWLIWGKQFREVIKDRPVITIPDDHDVGQGNIWGESGKVASSTAGSDGGYYYPPEYVNMVQRCQTWHLPDPVDPEPVQQNIGVYFTRLRLGGIDFAILEDRKFKSGPEGKIPQMGPRPDHITQEGYDPARVDLPELKLLGDRQLDFLHEWGQDWEGAEMKAALSQTAFCGAVHLHGSADNRLLADLDCNGWPQTGRNNALKELRRAMATHLCGDQHLSVIVKHGIDKFRDGPFAFTNPAIVNTYYGRWWWPKDEQPGGGEPIDNQLPWTGDYLDGLYNKITMIAYANPQFEGMKQMRDTSSNARVNLGDGYGLVRFNKKTREITYECWPRYADLNEGNNAQYKGWPFTFNMEENDGREVYGYLPELRFEIENPVVQVMNEETDEILYTLRIQGASYQPRVYSDGVYTVKAGNNKPDQWSLQGMKPQKNQTETIEVVF